MKCALAFTFLLVVWCWSVDSAPNRGREPQHDGEGQHQHGRHAGCSSGQKYDEGLREEEHDDRGGDRRRGGEQGRRPGSGDGRRQEEEQWRKGSGGRFREEGNRRHGERDSEDRGEDEGERFGGNGRRNENKGKRQGDQWRGNEGKRDDKRKENYENLEPGNEERYQQDRENRPTSENPSSTTYTIPFVSVPDFITGENWDQEHLKTTGTPPSDINMDSQNKFLINAPDRCEGEVVNGKCRVSA